MTDEQQLADAFWQMHGAVLRINEILSRNPALAENVPIKPPTILDADEIAAECRLLAEYYEKQAESGRQGSMTEHLPGVRTTTRKPWQRRRPQR